MFTSIRIQNFKSFRDSTQIDLAPLTFLAGVNSAGKSSLIQALLLLKQTLESGPTLALNPGKGTLLEQSLGERLNDFVYGRPPLSDATLTIELVFNYPLEEQADFYDDLRAMLLTPPVDLVKQELQHFLFVTFSWGPVGRHGQSAIRVAELKTQVNLAKEALLGLSIRPVGEDGYQIIPISESIHPSLADLDFSQLETGGFSHFLPDPFHLNYPKPGDKPIRFNDIPTSTPAFYRGLFAAARRDLSENIYYLNSFRRPPERIYTTTSINPEQLVPDGSNFARVLWSMRGRKPQEGNGDEPEPRKVRYALENGEIVEDFLPDMVRKVLLETLCLPQKVTVQSVGGRDDVLEVQVDTLGSEPIKVNLASVGLGYNQVLPIIIQGLLTPPGAVLVVEQPEIHLHPDVQERLVQFFIGLARSGRKVLIETHSSHMVDHLCLEIARDRAYHLEERASVFFIHPPDLEHASSRVELVKIDPFGVIQNYPPNFMPDVVKTYEEIVSEGFRKRKSQTGQGR